MRDYDVDRKCLMCGAPVFGLTEEEEQPDCTVQCSHCKTTYVWTKALVLVRLKGEL